MQALSNGHVKVGKLTTEGDLVVTGAASTGALSPASLAVTGAATVGTTLGVTGATTLASVGVTGAATVGTTLGVTGATTLASVGVTGAATVGTTLGVTGTTTLSTLTFSAGGSITRVMSGTVAGVDPASINAGAVGTVALTVTGVAAGDLCVMEPPAALEAGLVPISAIASADTITVTLLNTSAAPIDGAARDWAYRVLKIA